MISVRAMVEDDEEGIDTEGDIHTKVWGRGRSQRSYA